MKELLAKVPTPSQDLEMAKPRERIELLRDTLAQNGKYIANALDRFMSTDRFQRIVLTLVRDNKKLLECKPSSVILSALRIAQLRLSPDPALGQAWLIPRKQNAIFQMGWKGNLALAYRSKRIAAIRYGVVAVKDEFTWKDGKVFTLDHVPTDDGWPKDQGATRAAWGILDLRGGGQVPRVMFLPEILRHKSRGEGSQPAWVEDFAAMAVKTVLADLCRRGPVEEEMASALAWDAGEQPEDPELKDVTPSDAPDTSTKSGAFVAAFAERQTDPEPDDAPDFLGDALGQDGVTVAPWEAPEDAPPHVLKVLQAGARLGLTVADMERQVGAPVLTMPVGVEGEAISKLHAITK